MIRSFRSNCDKSTSRAVLGIAVDTELLRVLWPWIWYPVSASNITFMIRCSFSKAHIFIPSALALCNTSELRPCGFLESTSCPFAPSLLLIGMSNVNFPFDPNSDVTVVNSDDLSRSNGLIVCGWPVCKFSLAVEEVTVTSASCWAGIGRVVTTCVTAFEKNFSSL